MKCLFQDASYFFKNKKFNGKEACVNKRFPDCSSPSETLSTQNPP